MERSLDSSLEIHSAAASRLVELAEQIPDDRWFEPASAGKWSPSQIVEHLIATYDVLQRELEGGTGMKVRTKGLRRWLLRLTIAPRILAGRGFPANAPAPPELRPGDGKDKGRAEAIEMFRDRAEKLDQAVRNSPAGQVITHAYFGTAPIHDGVLLCARHIEHHAAQLPYDRAGSASAEPGA